MFPKFSTSNPKPSQAFLPEASGESGKSFGDRLPMPAVIAGRRLDQLHFAAAEAYRSLYGAGVVNNRQVPAAELKATGKNAVQAVVAPQEKAAVVHEQTPIEVGAQKSDDTPDAEALSRMTAEERTELASARVEQIFTEYAKEQSKDLAQSA